MKLVLKLTIFNKPVIQHSYNVIITMTLYPQASVPLANSVCVCLLHRIHPGLHHAICIPGGEKDGA